jgi:hypothetical protein
MCSTDEGINTLTLPLYVLTHIWDGDELTIDEMRNTQHETAMYNMHCVALVFDGSNKTVSIADHNGSFNNRRNIDGVHPHLH